MPTPRFVWKQIASGNQGPGKRSRHCLAHDPGAGATVLFSGILWHGSGRCLADTWELRGGVWSLIDKGTGPQARHRGVMVYDRSQQVCVLFGGQGQSGFGTVLGDTWTYAAGRWELKAAPSWRGPSGRCGHAFAFDEHLGAAVLFGGIGAQDATLGDTWLFDGSWHRVRGPAPPPRRYAGFAYDPALKGCLLYGGVHDDPGLHRLRDAWLFREQRWQRLNDRFAPDERDDHGMAYHPKVGALIMLDGIGSGQGVLARTATGWHALNVAPLQPRRQCSPLVWNDDQDGLLMHGGETGHRGQQLDVTLVLCLVEDATAGKEFARPNAGELIELPTEPRQRSQPVSDRGDEEVRSEQALDFLVWADSLRPKAIRLGGCLGFFLAWVLLLIALSWIPLDWTWYWIALRVGVATVVTLSLADLYIRTKLARWCRRVLTPLADQEGMPLGSLQEAVRRFESLDEERKKQLGDLNVYRNVLLRELQTHGNFPTGDGR